MEGKELRRRKTPYKSKVCSALNCSRRRYAGSDFEMHSFPSNPVRCKEWVVRSGNPKLLAKPISLVSHRAYLCQYHFTSDQYISLEKRRLSSSALPSIFPTTDIIQHSILTPTITSSSSTPISIVMSSSGSTSAEPLPSTSSQPQILSTISCQSLATPLPPSPVSCENPSQEIEIQVQPGPSTSTSALNPSLPGTSSASTSTFPCNTSKKVATRRVMHGKVAKTSILKDIGITRTDLTPRKAFLFLKYRNERRRNMYLKRKITFDNLKDLSATIEDKLDLNMKIFLQSQLRNIKRKPKGRRWNFKEKLFFVSLYKHSPLTYAYMKSKFTLPSRQTLLSVLNRVPFDAGINPGVVKHLSSYASRLSDCDKYCILLFDEMSIKPCLIYNPKTDCIEGFEDHGILGRSGDIAGTALVFMIRGLKLKWKQPVAYYFSKKTTPGLILADLIKEVLGALQSTGLKIVATVCDMGSNNTLTLKSLGSSVENPFFYFNGQKIFTLHDPPHLLKCTRNMLMKHPVKGKVVVGDEMIEGIGRWSHIEHVYRIRKEASRLASPPNVPLTNLREAHLNPTFKQKMKVNLAVGIFSPDVVKDMNNYRIFVNPELDTRVTTSFLSFIRNLFDSLNGVTIEGRNAKKINSSISEGSEHFSFWENESSKINQWVFLKSETNSTAIRPNSQNGWITTIRAVKLLWQKLKEAGFNLLEPRRLNQDPLEIFFVSIRLHCGANRNPTVQQFAAAFKASIIRNISSHLTRNMNCEPDDDTFIVELEEYLQLIPSFQKDPSDAQSTSADDSVIEMSVENDQASREWSAESFMMDISVSEICCSILKALLRNITCSTCVSLLTAKPPVMPESEISEGEALPFEYGICCPSEQIVKSFRSAMGPLQVFIHHNKTRKGIGSRGKCVVSGSFSWLHCEDHEIKERVANELVRYVLLRYCREGAVDE